MVETDGRPVVVYVEDDADTFKIAALRLESKYRLRWAQDDREAIDLISQHQRGLHAVLMDIELRGSALDGLDLVRLLRGLPLRRSGDQPHEPLPEYALKMPRLPNVPVIVLTAYTARYSEADAHAVGATHFATKPIDFTRLNLALAQANIAAVMRRLETLTGPAPAATVTLPDANEKR
jgi:CheY-like chemotaxis protein